MFSDIEKKKLNTLRDFLIEHKVLKEYCAALEHPEVYPTSRNLYFNDAIDIFNYTDALRIFDIDFYELAYIWRGLAYTDIFAISNIDRKELAEYLLSSTTMAKIITFAKKGASFYA